MEHVKLESLVDTVDFWSDPYTISQYVNSLIASCGKSDVVTIKIENYSFQPRVTFSTTWVKNVSVPHYTIYLPKIKDFYHNEEIKKQDIKLRKAFLKHEVAHIVFSEMDSYKSHKLASSNEEFLLNNALEDVRIEHKFGQRFHGANDAFFEVQESFYKKAKEKIENEKPTLFILALYIMYRSKKFSFDNTQAVQLYERYYQKYKNFLNLSQLELSELTKKIKNEFETELGYFSQNEENVPQNESDNSSNDNKNSDSELSNQNSEGNEDSEGEEDSEGDEDSDSNNSSNSNKKSKSSSSDEDSESDEDSKSTSNKTNGNGKTDKNNVNEKVEDFSDQLASEMQSNAKKEEDAQNELKKENQESQLNNNEFDESGNVKVFSLKSLSPNEIEDLLVDESENDFVRYDNSSMKVYSSEIVDVSQYAALVAKRTNFSTNTADYRRKQYSGYEKVVAKNRKNINSLVNYFKLKFQQKERSLKSFNKEDGLLNNESLYKLFKSDSDKKIFYTVEKCLVTKSDVSFLLDFSGSMSGNKVRSLVQTLIVLNEVFTKLEISFNVFSFSGRGNYANFYYKTKNEKTLLKKAYASVKTVQVSSENEVSICFGPKPEVSYSKQETYCWVNKKTKANDRKKILSLLNKVANEKAYGTEFNKNWGNVFFGGGTPEVQSVIALYNKLPAQKLFIINDGSYDGVNLNSEEKLEAVEALNKKSYLACARAFLPLLEGKKLYFSSEQQLDTFKNEITWVASFLLDKYNSSYDTQLLSQDSLTKVRNILSNLSSLLYNFRSNKNKNFVASMPSGTGTIKQTYLQGRDVYEVSASLEKLPVTVSLLKNSYSETFSLSDFLTTYGEKEENEQERKVTLLFEKNEFDSYEDLFRYKVYAAYHCGTLSYKIGKTRNSEYTYRSLFQKMRNEGWSVWGIGIESWSASNYLGKENFSFVQNSKDIQDNLEKRVKSVV